MKRALVFLLAVAASLAACRKKPLPPDLSGDTIDPGYGVLRLAFANRAGAEPLVLNTQTYVNASGDSFTVSRFKYFISNIRLGNDRGWTDYLKPTYNLIDQAGSRIAATDTAILSDTFTRLRFMVGVDSARNVSGAQEGDLDPAGVASGMFWDWNTGYIMAMMEGHSPQSGDTVNHRFFHHLGGFSGRFAAQRWIEVELPTPAIIRGGHVTEIHLSADILKWFSGGLLPIDLTDTYYAMTPGATTQIIANNMARMFRVDAVHNE